MGTGLDTEACFKDYSALVYRRALVLTGSPSEAQDVTQEVFVRVLERGEQFRSESKVFTWLYQITTNYCLNQIRNRKRRTAILEEHHAGRSADIPGAPEYADMVTLRRLLVEADARQARAAVYIYVDGMTINEAADMLECSPRTVGNLLKRFGVWARAHLERAGDASSPSTTGAGG